MGNQAQRGCQYLILHQTVTNAIHLHFIHLHIYQVGKRGLKKLQCIVSLINLNSTQYAGRYPIGN